MMLDKTKEQYQQFIDGVGKDEPVTVGSHGGAQSKSPAYIHLIDPQYLLEEFQSVEGNLGNALKLMAVYMKTMDVLNLYASIDNVSAGLPDKLLTIGQVLQYGHEKYKAYGLGNWRLIPREEHLNHALIHLLALYAGDTQDDHRSHAMCRLMMAIATRESEGFSYTQYVPPETKGDQQW